MAKGVAPAAVGVREQSETWRAYRIYARIAAHAADPAWGLATASGVPLLPLFQRHLTERLLAGLRGAPEPLVPAAQHAATGAARLPIYLRRLLVERRAAQVLPRRDGRPRILVHPFFPNHLPSLLPLIDHLGRDRGHQVVVAGANPSTRGGQRVNAAPLAPLDVPYLPFEAAAGLRHLRALPGQIRAALAARAVVRGAPFQQRLPLEPEAWALAAAPLANLMGSYLPKILLYLELADALYARVEPDLVVVTDETLPLIGRVALAAAARRGIPTLTVQHGLLLDDPMYYGPPVADRVALWGEASARFLGAHGCPPDRLVVTGAARFDPPPAPDPVDLAAHLSLEPGTRIILFTSQPSGRDVPAGVLRQTVVALARATAAVGRAHLLIRPHPAQAEMELHTALASVPGAPVTVARTPALHAALAAAALCVTVFSTTGLEALLLERPLLAINLTGRPAMIPYVEAGAAFGAARADEVEAALRRALDPALQQAMAPARAAFVRDHLGPLDGRSLERLGAVVEQLLAGGR